MRDISRKLLVILPVSFLCSVFVCVISSLLLQDCFFVANFVVGLIIFLTTEFFSFKLIEMFLLRKEPQEQENTSSISGQLDISDDIHFDYQLNYNATVDEISIDEKKKLVFICDVLDNKPSTEIIRNLSLNAIEFISSPENLTRTMKLLDFSVHRLNMKNATTFMFILYVDLERMSCKFVNASNYDVFITSRNVSNAKNIPLACSKYRLCNSTQDSFGEYEYFLENDDVVSLKIAETK